MLNVSVIAFALRMDEFDIFLKKYYNDENASYNSYCDKLEEAERKHGKGVDLDTLPFAVGLSMSCGRGTFDFTIVCPEVFCNRIDFMAFSGNPFEVRPAEELFTIVAENQMSTPYDITNGIYPSYDSLETEIRNKIGKYLPDGFTWEDHIGVINATTW